MYANFRKGLDVCLRIIIIPLSICKKIKFKFKHRILKVFFFFIISSIRADKLNKKNFEFYYEKKILFLSESNKKHLFKI